MQDVLFILYICTNTPTRVARRFAQALFVLSANHFVLVENIFFILLAFSDIILGWRKILVWPFETLIAYYEQFPEVDF